MKFFKTFFTITLFFFISSSYAASAVKTLSLDEYIDQVKGKNLEYLAASQNEEAYQLLRRKADLVTAVGLFANTQTGFTEQNQALQVFRYTKVFEQKNQIGLTQNSSFGLNTRLYYSLNRSTYKDLNTSNLPNPSLASSYYQAIPTIEATFPLWKNLLGSSTRASMDSIRFFHESKRLSSKADSLSSIATAEVAYWNLVIARKIVEIRQAALKSTVDTLNYVTRRAKMNLGEKGDIIQATALMESRKLLLQQAENDVKIAINNFNKNRFFDSDQVIETLSDIDFNYLTHFSIPTERTGTRIDVKAKEASMRAAIADAKIDEENSKPALDLYGSYLQTQIRKNSMDALNNTFDKNGRAGLIGVRFSMPINIGINSDIRSGAIKSASAARIDYQNTLLSQENDWKNLVQSLTNYQQNLRLALEIEKVQKSKLDNEQLSLRQGRTTTYQILLFEQDYSNSQLTSVTIAGEILRLVAERKLYQP